MITAAASLVVAATLVVAAAGKVRRRPALAACELALGVGVAVSWFPAQIGAAVLLCAFAIWLAWSLARGRRGTPCGCFGAVSVVSPLAAARAAALALVAAGLAIAPAPRISPSDWAIVALAAALAVAIAIAFTLAREVARLRSTRGGALELDGEGPELGAACPVWERFRKTEAPVAVAVFVSPGCAMCVELEPAVAALARDLPVEVFDEERDALAWQVSHVPGSPYAVALDGDGIALAKGTFNTPAQLRSIPATALYRLGGEVMHG